MLQRFPIIVGPTAGGKTALALELARLLDPRSGPPDHGASPAERDALARARSAWPGGAEVVSADSMQVFRRMDIGTAKPTPDERAAARHHLIDILDPSESFSVDRWLSLAEPIVAELRERGVLPIVVGGTHLYAKALLEGLFDAPDPDPALRAELGALETPVLRARLEAIDPAAAGRIHFNDRRRTVRALEVHAATGTPISDLQRQWDEGPDRPDAAPIVVEWPTGLINRRINDRVRWMFDAGLVGEVRGILDAGGFGPQSAQALGYKQLIEVVESGRVEDPDALRKAGETIKVQTRRFAKNQRTWLKRLSRHPNTIRIPASEGPPAEWSGWGAWALGRLMGEGTGPDPGSE